jgi:AmmeMemoRadiSam system protein B
MNELTPVRPSPIAGSWYPGDPVTLRSTVSKYIDDARLPALSGKVIGVVSPHAGYIYSGLTAGYAYRAIQGCKFDTVIIVSPLHAYRPEPFLTSAHESYATPLGEIKINQSLLKELQKDLAAKSAFEITRIAFDREHSLEIQLPFLQCSLAAPFTLLPLMVREYRPEELALFASSLASILAGKKVLLVASTDLSHFYTEQQANELDQVMLEQIHQFSPAGVLQAEATGKGFACGNGAVAVVLWAAQQLGGKTVTILHHSTSAEATGDRSQVVGYGAAAICT